MNRFDSLVESLQSSSAAIGAVASTVKTTLGPCGRDKLLLDAANDIVAITNDGASIVRHLSLNHPASRLVVEAAVRQDDEVGDGTTSVVLLCSALVSISYSLIIAGVSSKDVVWALEYTLDMVETRLSFLSLLVRLPSKRAALLHATRTCINSKAIRTHLHFFSELIVDAVSPASSLTATTSLPAVHLVGMTGADARQSKLIHGLVLGSHVLIRSSQQQKQQSSSSSSRSTDGKRVMVLRGDVFALMGQTGSGASIRPSIHQQKNDEEEGLSVEENERARVRNLVNNLLASLSSTDAAEVGLDVVFSEWPLSASAEALFLQQGVMIVSRLSPRELHDVAAVCRCIIVADLEFVIQDIRKRSLSSDFLGSCRDIVIQEAYSSSSSTSSSTTASSATVSLSSALSSTASASLSLAPIRLLQILSSPSLSNEPQPVTLLLRAATEAEVGETKRAVNDAISVLQKLSSGKYLPHTGINRDNSRISEKSSIKGKKEKKKKPSRFKVRSASAKATAATTATTTTTTATTTNTASSPSSTSDNLMIIPGGGLSTIFIAAMLQEIGNQQYEKEFTARQRFVLTSLAPAFEIIVKTLAENAGRDAIEVLDVAKRAAQILARHCLYGGDKDVASGKDGLDLSWIGQFLVSSYCFPFNDDDDDNDDDNDDDDDDDDDDDHGNRNNYDGDEGMKNTSGMALEPLFVSQHAMVEAIKTAAIVLRSGEAGVVVLPPRVATRHHMVSPIADGQQG